MGVVYGLRPLVVDWVRLTMHRLNLKDLCIINGSRRL